MALLRPTRRQLIGSLPLVVGALALPAPLLAAPEEPLLRFFAVGDWGRNGHTNQATVAGLMAASAADARPEFIASTGDNFYLLGVKDAEDPKWQTSFENVYTGSLRRIPWYAVLGNHDYGGNVDAQRTYGGSGRWNMPYWRDRGESAGMRTYRLRDGSSADFFFVDTVAWIGREGFPFSVLGSPLPPDEQAGQRRWLEDALGRSHARYKFVFGHHGIYSIGPHGGHPLMMDLDLLMRAHDVTAYVHGHDHCLYHVTLAGMSYVCSGGGSEVKHIYKGGKHPGCVYQGFCDPAGGDLPFPFWHTYIEDAGFAVFSLYPQRWEFRFVTRNPTPADTPTHFISSPATWAPAGTAERGGSVS